MANTDWAFGFVPYLNLLRAQYYAVATAPVINFYHGDIVGVDGLNYTTPKMGYLPGVLDATVPDGKDNMVGAVLGIFDENMDPVKYIAATEAGNSTIAGYLLVADHPDQLFVGREDFNTNAIDLNEGALSADIISVSLCAGNTSTGRSTQLIDSTTAAAATALQLKIYGPHPNDTLLVADDTPGSSADEGARYIVSIQEHYWQQSSIAGGLSA